MAVISDAKRPVLITGLLRSVTLMVAGALASCGLWIGETVGPDIEVGADSGADGDFNSIRTACAGSLYFNEDTAGRFIDHHSLLDRTRPKLASEA